MTLDPQTIVDRMYLLAGLEPPTLCRADVEARGGVAPERTQRWWRAMGLPEAADDELVFGEEDLDMVRTLRSLIETGVLDDDDILRVARVSGAAFTRLVDAQLDLIESLLAAGPDADPDETDRDRLATLIERADDDITALLERAMLFVWRHHLLAGFGRRLRVDDSEESTEVAVAFADMAGFSRLAKRSSPGTLSSVIEQFEAAAFDVIAAHNGRVIKLIGDEVMFTADDGRGAVDICLDFIDRLDEAPDVPPLHCGVAHGPVVELGGDVFGPTVNLASRLTKVARPGSVAVHRSLGQELSGDDHLELRRGRRARELKGIGPTPVTFVRRWDPAD